MITRTPILITGKQLSIEELKSSVPAAFATHASPKMSDRYAFVSTMQTIKPLLDAGFVITGAGQRATRRRNPAHTRHLLRLRPIEAKPLVGDTFPEILLINSHDGQSKYSVYGGLFRLACLNGLVVSLGDSAQAYLRRHVGDPKTIVSDSRQVIEHVQKLGATLTKMTKTKLTEKQMNSFAISAAKLAYDEAVNFDPKLLLQVRRDADKPPTVWAVYNRVQENLTRGGLSFEVNHRPITTRGITHIGRNTDLNLGLWSLAEKAVA